MGGAEKIKKTLPRYITIKLLKAIDKEKGLKYPEENPHVKGTKMKMLADF